MTSTKSICFSRTQNESMDLFRIRVGKSLFSYKGEMTPEVIAKRTKKMNDDFDFTPFQMYCVVQDICSFFGVAMPEKPTIEKYDNFVKSYLI